MVSTNQINNAVSVTTLFFYDACLLQVIFDGFYHGKFTMFHHHLGGIFFPPPKSRKSKITIAQSWRGTCPKLRRSKVWRVNNQTDRIKKKNRCVFVAPHELLSEGLAYQQNCFPYVLNTCVCFEKDRIWVYY